MLQVIPQTRKEKVKMYKKMKKREIIEMLLTNQDMIENFLSLTPIDGGSSYPNTVTSVFDPYIPHTYTVN